MKDWKTRKLKDLSRTLLSLESESEILAFLRDVCTLEELNVLSTRWEAAQLLHKGVPYRKIAAKTGLSTATVTRIAYWLKHGEGGYRKAIIRKNT